MTQGICCNEAQLSNDLNSCDVHLLTIDFIGQTFELEN